MKSKILNRTDNVFYDVDPNTIPHKGSIVFNKQDKRLEVIGNSITSYPTAPLANGGVSTPLVAGQVVGIPDTSTTLSVAGGRSMISKVPHPNNTIFYLWYDESVKKWASGNTADFTFPDDGEEKVIKVYACDSLMNASNPVSVTLTGDALASGNGNRVVPFSHTFPEVVKAGKSGSFRIVPGTDQDGNYYSLDLSTNSAIEVKPSLILFPTDVDYVISDDLEELGMRATITVHKKRGTELVEEYISARVEESGVVEEFNDIDIVFNHDNNNWYVNSTYQVVTDVNYKDTIRVEYINISSNIDIERAENRYYGNGDIAKLKVLDDTDPVGRFTVRVTDIVGNYKEKDYTINLEQSTTLSAASMSLNIPNTILGATGTYSFTGAEGGIGPYTYSWSVVEPTNILDTQPNAAPDPRYNYPLGGGNPITILSSNENTITIVVNGNPGYFGTTAPLMVTVTDSFGTVTTRTFYVKYLDDYQYPITENDLALTEVTPDVRNDGSIFPVTVSYPAIVRNGISFQPGVYLVAASNCTVNGESSTTRFPHNTNLSVELNSLPPAYFGTYGLSVYPNIGRFTHLWTWTQNSPVVLTGQIVPELIQEDVRIVVPEVHGTKNNYVSPSLPYTWETDNPLGANYVAVIDELGGAFESHSYEKLLPKRAGQEIVTITDPHVASPYQPEEEDELWSIGQAMRVMLSMDPTDTSWPNVPGIGLTDLRVILRDEETLAVIHDSGNLVGYNVLTDPVSPTRPRLQGNIYRIDGLPQDHRFYICEIKSVYNYTPIAGRPPTTGGFVVPSSWDDIISTATTRFLGEHLTTLRFRSTSGSGDYTLDRHYGEEYIIRDKTTLDMKLLSSYRTKRQLRLKFYKEGAINANDYLFTKTFSIDNLYPTFEPVATPNFRFGAKINNLPVSTNYFYPNLYEDDEFSYPALVSENPSYLPLEAVLVNLPTYKSIYPYSFKFELIPGSDLEPYSDLIHIDYSWSTDDLRTEYFVVNGQDRQICKLGEEMLVNLQRGPIPIHAGTINLNVRIILPGQSIPLRIHYNVIAN